MNSPLVLWSSKLRVMNYDCKMHHFFHVLFPISIDLKMSGCDNYSFWKKKNLDFRLWDYADGISEKWEKKIFNSLQAYALYYSSF